MLKSERSTAACWPDAVRAGVALKATQTEMMASGTETKPADLGSGS